MIEEVFKNILERRNTKPDKFTGNTIDDSLVEKMLEAAHWAPTHGNTEPWQFKVFTGAGKDVLFKFLKEWHLENGDNEIKIEKTRKRIYATSHIISIAMKRGDNPKIPEIEELLAVGAAVQNMWLVAQAQGLGAYWSTGARAFHPKMKAFLGLGEQDKSLGFLYVGEKAVKDLPGHRLTKVNDHVDWIKD
ncbi:MAG: nitroreductase [Schleiferiaceae bacterium]|nr:nitroreductase [Schleiferiaceae bacterium]